MVDADDVEALPCCAQASHPPGEAVLFHVRPVIDGIAPILSIGVEAVRRAARNDAWTAGTGQLEILRVRPDVGGIQRNIDGDIADNQHTVFMGILPQTLPLRVEAVLEEAMKIKFVVQQLPIMRHRLGLVHPDIERPLGPRAVVIICLDGHKEYILLQPRTLLADIFRVALRRGLVEAAPGQMQHPQALVVHLRKIDLIGAAAPIDAVKLLLRQVSVLDKLVQIDQIRVPGEGRERLIGRIAIAGRVDREDLPVGLLCRSQKINKVIGCFSHAADAVGRGQRSNVHQDSTASFHTITLISLSLKTGKSSVGRCFQLFSSFLTLSRLESVNGTVIWRACPPRSVQSIRTEKLRRARSSTDWETVESFGV